MAQAADLNEALLGSTVSNEYTEAIKLNIAQNTETKLSSVLHDRYKFRYLYTRSTDSRASGGTGEDYLVLKHDEDMVVFALCDGAGQTFLPFLASKFLGDHLVEWLWQETCKIIYGNGDRTITSQDILRIRLRDYLVELESEANYQIETYPLNPKLPESVVSALEEKRIKGSESTFVCGCLILPSHRIPHGILGLAWQGDSKVEVWGENGIRLGMVSPEDFLTKEHWSSKHGLSGRTPKGIFTTLSQVKRIVAFSDGLKTLASRLDHEIEDQELALTASDIASQKKSDDIAFIEFTLRQTEIRREALLPSPEIIGVETNQKDIVVTWTPAPGADFYEIEITVDFKPPTSEHTSSYRWASRVEPSWEGCQVRLRSHVGDSFGSWSRPIIFGFPRRKNYIALLTSINYKRIFLLIVIFIVFYFLIAGHQHELQTNNRGQDHDRWRGIPFHEN